jgi:hypothetical protein
VTPATWRATTTSVTARNDPDGAAPAAPLP